MSLQLIQNLYRPQLRSARHRARREASPDGFDCSYAWTELAYDGGDEGVDEVVGFYLDEFGDFDGGGETEGEEVGADEIDDLG